MTDADAHDEAQYTLTELDLRVFPKRHGKQILRALDASGGLMDLCRAYVVLSEVPERLAAALAAEGLHGELHVVIGISTERETIARVEYEPATPKGPAS